jgi:CheY-like chemotaxis protein
MAVLIVDDDPAIRTLLVDLLEDEGYEVASAANGQEALRYLHDAQTPPRIILLDLMMPVMSGWQFRDVQRQRPELAQIPVIVLSASENLPEAARVLAASAYVPKPVNLERLTQIVDALYRTGDGATARPQQSV